MNILVTGAKGFIGKNLLSQLRNIHDGKAKNYAVEGNLTLYEYDLDSTPEELDLYCKNADFVFNLAGVNRPQDPVEFMKGNFGFASTLGYDTYSEARQFFISYSYNDYRPLNGKIAEARVWSVARTPEQIWENMYNVENPKDDPTLLGYWKFNDGKGNTVKDYSRYGNDCQAKYDLKWPDGIEIPKINEVEE